MAFPDRPGDIIHQEEKKRVDGWILSSCTAAIQVTIAVFTEKLYYLSSFNMSRAAAELNADIHHRSNNNASACKYFLYCFIRSLRAVRKFLFIVGENN